MKHKSINIIFLLLSLLLASCATALDRAATAVEEGNYDQALIEYNAALSEELSAEDQFAALTGRAWVYNQQGKSAEALADYADALTVTNDEGAPAGDIRSVYRSRIDILTKDEAWELAAADVDNLISLNPQNLELHIQKGRLLTNAGAWGDVVSSMDAALAISPSSADALTLRGTAHLNLANYEQAIEDLKASLDGEVAAAMSDIDRRSNLVDAYYELGQALYRLGEKQAAIDNFTEALDVAKSDEDIALILAERGFTYSEIEEDELALTDINRALELDPSMAIAYSYRSYIFSSREQYDEAIADADKAIELGQDLSANTRSAILHAKASALRNSGRYEEALLAATQSIELEGVDNPDTARTYSMRSHINRLLENYEQAVADADQAISIGAQDIGALPGFYNNRSRAYFELDQVDKALEDQLAAVELGRQTEFDFEYLGDLYAYNNDFTNAIIAYDSAIALAPEDSLLHYYQGSIYESMGDNAAAISKYQQAAQLDPTDASYLRAIADVFWLEGDYESAAANYQQAIAIDPTNPWYHNYLGDIYYETEQYELAESEYLIATNTDNTIGLFPENLGVSRRLQENFSGAVEAYNLAIAIDPERPFSWFGRGYSYYWLNQDDAAIPDLQKAKEFEIDQDLIDFIDELLAEMGA